MPPLTATLKRSFDVLLSGTALLLLLPLLVFIATVILVLDGRPIIYSEQRLGYRQRLFNIYKFRTLNPSTQDCSVATSKDVRLTVSGGFLRRRHLDELLQLLNILRGDMSLVGPRPLKPVHANTLSKHTLQELLCVRPGLTGPASIKFIAEDEALACVNNPERVYLMSVLPAKIDCQLDYIHNHSLCLDLKLILRTLHSLFSARVYARSIQRVNELLPPGNSGNGIKLLK